MRNISTTHAGMSDEYLFCDEPSELSETYERYHAKHRDASYMRDWYGGLGTCEGLRRAQSGDNALVAASDALISKLEDQIIHSKKWRNIDDVVGSLPNVPAYLAGYPCAMRRRIRVDRDDAPLCIFIDLTSSGGIDARKVLARGTAVLALARMLIEHRAVTLWAGIALGGGRVGSSTVAWRIDTAPLDLARAAHLLCAPIMSRGVGYELSYAAHGSSGSWPLGSYEKHKASAQGRLQAVMGCEICYVPPIYLTDALVNDPLGWIKRELARYTGSGGDARNTEDGV